MKKNFLYSALLCASAALISSCTIAEIDTRVPAADGSEIIFGSRGGFENAIPETKTIYTGETYTVGTTRFERIDWVDASDKIEVYSPEARFHNSHYQVEHSKDHDTQKDYATLSRIGDHSLQWNGDDTHHFYAMYPSSLLFADNESTVKQGVMMDGTTLKGIVPTSQNPIRVDETPDGYVLVPDMRYAYMAAKSSATRFDKFVPLSFVPIVTAVEVSMVLPKVAAGQPIKISEIRVSGAGIAGAFTADLSEEGWTGVYPTCVNTGAGSNIIQITPSKDVLEIGQDKSLTFTVFLRPGSDISDLTIQISSEGSSYVGKRLGDDDSSLVIPKGKKTVITGLRLPQAIKIDASKWMSQLDENTALNRLSIPGTGSTFSFNYKSNDEKWIKSQTLSLEEQWNRGIRAFEIISERQSDSRSSLGSTQVMCNNMNMGQTVDQVFKTLYKKVTAQGSSETAILILTYQPSSIRDTYAGGRDPISYLNSLKVWYNSMSAQEKAALAKFTPEMTLEQAKNHILIIVRPTQRDEDYQTERNLDAIKAVVGDMPILVVDGCGTAKDRWGARGYTVNNKRALDISNYTYAMGNGTDFMEYYMNNNTYINPLSHNNVKKGVMNFAFNTSTDGVQCWYQEWQRVIPRNMRKNGSASLQYPSWFESYTEKLNDVKETFSMAVSDLYQSQYVFINSLCGHFATTDRDDSLMSAAKSSRNGTDYWGGTSGDIAALASTINNDFYEYVRNSGFENQTGPTGIVMMNFVSENESDGGSYYLPGAIISNNFKHNVGQN